MPDEYDDLLDSVLPKPSRPARRGVTRFQPDSDWTLDALKDVEAEYQRSTGRALPVSVRGQGRIHNKWGLQHQDSADVGLNPGTDEGRALEAVLRQRNVPFMAFDRAIPGVATGPHFHIGRPSRRGASPQKQRDAYDALLDNIQGQTPPPTQTVNTAPVTATQSANRPASATSVPVSTGRFGAPRDKSYSRPLRPRRQLAEIATGGVSVVAPPGVGELRRIDDPETQRITRIQRAVTSEQTPVERETRRAPGTANARLLEPKLTENEEVLRRLEEEQDTAKRQADAAVEAKRLMAQFTPQDKAEIADFVDHLKGKGSTYTGVRTGARSVGSSGLYKLAGLTDIANAIQKPITGEDSWIPDYLKRKALAGELSVDDIPVEQRGQVAEFLTQMGLGLAEIVATPGGPVTKFAGLAGTESIGRGQSPSEVARETAKGATIGQVFKSAGRMSRPAETVRGRAANLAKEGAAIGAGTYAVERGFETPVEDAALSAATNVALHGLLGARRLRGRRPEVVPPERIEDARQTQSDTGGEVVQRASDRPVSDDRATGSQRFQHLQFGEVEVTPDQSGARKGRIKVAEISDPTKIHFVAKADMQGRGNARMIPIKEPQAVEGEAGKDLATPTIESPPTAPPSTANVASVPFMITRRMEADLKARGYAQESIDRLTPQQANDILAQPSSGKVGASPPEITTAEHSLRSEPKEVAALTQPAATEGAGGRGAPEIPAPNIPAEPSITSARKGMFKADRAELDLPELSPAERKGWQKTLDEAKAKGTKDAGIIADEVLAKPRALNDVETGQLVLRAQEVKNEHSRIMKEIGDETNPERIEAKRAQTEALEREFDRLTTATKASGTEKGRALASQKLTINQDFDLVSVLQRVKAAKGRELTGEERQKFEGMTKQIEELQIKLAKAEADALARSIQKDIDRVRRQIKRGETKEVLDQEFVLLKTEFAQARLEAKGVQAAGLAGIDPEGKLTPIILKMARNRVKAGVVKAEDVVDHVYGAVKEHIEGVSNDDIRRILAGHNLDRDPLPAIKTRLRKQEADLTRRLEEKDFTPPSKRPKVVYDREAANLKAQVEGLKRKVEAEIKGTDSRIDTALNMWKAGLLTGPRTHMRNIGGTAGFQTFEEVSRVPGAVADLLTSTVTGRRALGGPSPTAVARSSYEAATKGIREARQIIRYGATAEELKVIDRPREANSGSKIIDTYINTVFRTLGAEDKVFRTYAYKRSIIEQAKLRAKSEGKTAKELEENPTPEMVSQGLLDAEVATFNNENVAAKGVQWAREHSGPVGKVAIDLVVPFKRTPANIMTRLLESTPLGLLKGGGQLVKAGINKKFSFEDQRKFSQTIGRSVTGSSLIVLGWKLAEQGLATGLYEDDRGDREVQKASGRSPMAVKIGDAWHQIGSFSPIGNLIAIGAALYREKTRPPKEGEEPPNLAAAALPVVAKSVLEQPMLRGMSGVVDAIKEPGARGSTLIGRTAGSFVPTIVSDAGAVLDDKRREARGITDKVIARIPIARRSLPEDIDVFGRPLESRRTAAVDPTLTTTAKDEPFIKELLRLDIGIVKSNKRPGEDAAAHRERIITQGKEMAKELAKLTDSPAYKSASDDDKREMIKGKAEQVRKAVNEFIKTGGKRVRSARKPRERREAYRYAPQ